MKVNWLHVVIVALMFWLVGIAPFMVRDAQAGSGESLKMQECRRILFDEYVIADARLRGTTKQDLIAAAQEKLEGARQENALSLIELAYAAEDVKAWFQEKWFACLGNAEMEKSGFTRIRFASHPPRATRHLVLVASSQRLYCSAVAQAAEAMLRDFQATEFRPEHLANEHQRAIALTALACQKAGEPVTACVERRCMGQGA